MPSITRKSKSGRAERRAEISADLLTAIERLLTEGVSYTEISVERLCTESGISRSTFYAYFEDKGHLLRELTAELLTALGSIAARWWTAGPDITYDELRDVMRDLIGKYREHDALLGAVADTAVYDPAVREVFGGLIDSFINEITQMIEVARKQGDIPVTGPARETAALLTWMAVHGYYQLVRGADDAEINRLTEAHSEILWCTVHGGKRTK